MKSINLVGQLSFHRTIFKGILVYEGLNLPIYEILRNQTGILNFSETKLVSVFFLFPIDLVSHNLKY